jgi:hypothetical protein
MNCTDTQQFTVYARPIPPTPPPPPPGGRGGGGGGDGGDEGGLTGYVTGEAEEIRRKVKRFSVDPEYFKVSLKQGSTETRILTINNLGNSDLSFNLTIVGAEGFVILSEEGFDLPFGETKKITVDFTTQKETPPEEYFGSIIVNSTESVEIP